jgi:hypothetical protein
MLAKEIEDQRICGGGGTAGIGKAIAQPVAMLAGSVLIASRST